jgi:hypothetical protein
MIDDVLIFREVGIDDAPDFHEVPLQIGGEAGKELPAAGLLQGFEVGMVFPLHGAGGDIVNQALDFGGGEEEVKPGGQELPGLDLNFGHGTVVFLYGEMKRASEPYPC